jgi:hypothetical protein
MRMFFLLRMAFWLGLVLILLPSGSAQRNLPPNGVSASDAISAASATLGDLREFCARQPDACTVGSHAASAIGYKARAGAKMLYDLLSEALAPRESALPASAKPVATSGKPLPDKAVVEPASENTLTPGDLAPPWRGPSPRNEGKRSV